MEETLETVEKKTEESTVKETAEETIEFHDFSGPVARLTIYSARKALRKIPWEDSEKYFESIVQLKESERYEYTLEPSDHGKKMCLRCKQSSRWESLKGSIKEKYSDAGLIETKSYCGKLLLEVVEDGTDEAASSIKLDVVPVKLDYRTHYREMLSDLTDQISGLILDARSSTKINFKPFWEIWSEEDKSRLQLQMELLREIVEDSSFACSLRRIIAFPHERLCPGEEPLSSDRPIVWGASAMKQLVTGAPRREVPMGHPLHSKLKSVASRIFVPVKSRSLDTPENRFIKYILWEFREFLSQAQEVFEKLPGWKEEKKLAERLAENIGNWLGFAFFNEIGEMRFAPLGSPVLQRKGGYRDILRFWLRFRACAELSWEGGADVFGAGGRNLAVLYEYWLFFVLLELFFKIAGKKASTEDLLSENGDGSMILALKKSKHLGPYKIVVSGKDRSLNATFDYNRRFDYPKESWSLPMHPDYTFSFWPADLDINAAEQTGLLVRLHFDAKYRLENPEKVNEAETEEIDEGNYKRQDILKMHAYKDAIKRSEGAYVLYPYEYNSDSCSIYKEFHEILPGLGAFGILPERKGKGKDKEPYQGVDALEKFLNEVIAHLCDKATAREKTASCQSQAYKSEQEKLNHPHPNGPVLVVKNPCLKKDNNLAYIQIYHPSLKITPVFSELRHILVCPEEETGGNFSLFSVKEGFEIVLPDTEEKTVYLRFKCESELKKYKELSIPNFLPLEDDFRILRLGDIPELIQEHPV